MLKVGIVGARGLSTMLGFRAQKNVKVTALCDINGSFLEEQARKYEIPNTYRVYEDMIESDIDVVVVATPMQLHVQQSIYALEAGKHVLCEVTAGVTMDELWWLRDAVEKSGKVYMMAENYCYMPYNQLISNMVDLGMFGDVYYAEGEYLHELKEMAYVINRSDMSYSEAKSWRNYWQLGKRGNFYPTHSLGPIMKWFKGDRIKSVSCFGTGWHTTQAFRQEDTSVTMCQLESGKLIKLRLDCISNRPHNLTYYTLQGTKGSFEAPRGLGDAHKIYLKDTQPDSAQWEPLADYTQYLPERYQIAAEEQKSAGHGGGDFFIIQDFIDAIMDNKTPYVDVYDACEWTAVGLLSELSITNGGKSIEMPNFRTAKSYRDQEIKI